MSNPKTPLPEKNKEFTDTASTDNDYPGYPSHPASEDILNQKNVEQVKVDMDNFSRSEQYNSANATGNQPKKDREHYYVSDDEADVSSEEKALLESTDGALPSADQERLADATLDATDADGELLNEYYSDRDIDVPGSEADDDMEDIGEEDEENNYYSLGGDRQEGLEESKE